MPPGPGAYSLSPPRSGTRPAKTRYRRIKTHGTITVGEPHGNFLFHTLDAIAGQALKVKVLVPVLAVFLATFAKGVVLHAVGPYDTVHETVFLQPLQCTVDGGPVNDLTEPSLEHLVAESR